MNDAYGFTVLTPTYNRAHTLPRVYQTLLNQSFGDFEWLIIDDGSTDGTSQAVSEWISEKKIPVRYIWQQNQHKKSAINHGVREAQGMLLVILDSDDELLPDALEKMWTIWHQIPDNLRHSYVAVTGLCLDETQKIVGDTFPFEQKDMTSIDMFFKYRPAGEKFGCLNTRVMRQYPYPDEISGFVPESLIWRKIARQGYLTRFVNQPFRIYHDSRDSLSRGGQEDISAFALGYLLIARDTLVNCLGWFFCRPSEFFRAAARYNRFRLYLRRKNTVLPPLARLKGLTPRLLAVFGWPAGYLRYRKDLRRRPPVQDQVVP